jgi:hypothetical protein
LRVEIVDGIGGAVTQDKAGYNNDYRLNLTALTATHTSHFFSFRLTREVAQPCYLRVRVVNPPGDLDAEIYLDEMAVVRGTQLYAGGPWVAAFPGATPAVIEDKWTLTVTNNRAGMLQDYCDRLFDLAGKGLMFPSNTTSTETIPDSVIA